MLATLFSLSLTIVGWSQLILCFRAQKKWLRFLPLTLAVSGDLVCWLLYFVSFLIRMEDSLGYPSIVLAMLGLFWVLAALVGWGAYGLVKLIQKLFQ